MFSLCDFDYFTSWSVSFYRRGRMAVPSRVVSARVDEPLCIRYSAWLIVRVASMMRAWLRGLSQDFESFSVFPR